MSKQSENLLMEQLIGMRVFAQEQGADLLKQCDASGMPLRQFLLSRQLVTEQQMLEALAALYRMETLRLSEEMIDPAVIERVPVRFTTYYKIMPVRIQGKEISLASSVPLDVRTQDEIRLNLGLHPKFFLVKESELKAVQKKYYGLAAETVDRMAKAASGMVDDRAQDDRVEDIDGETDEASVTSLVNEILLDAYHNRATDIHIEPYRNKVRLRYRVDGVLMDANIPPAARPFLSSIISRIKILSNLSIVERRLPQDGSAVVRTKEQTLDLRVSTIPTPRGESMVIRILPTQMTLLSLENLGLAKENLRAFRDLVKKPHGIILVTGPTGSGKTTTLYACLHEINSPGCKIITLEDPIEYEMEGITQIQVNPKFDFDFAAGLRSVLRHDPDIIMVGEIRDVETAEIAIRTALTGHLVFSTLHTNDAASGITRLLEMGLEPFLVSSSIEAFVAQRLVRLICPKCKEEVKTPLLETRQEIAQSLGMETAEHIKIYRGRGCDHCHQTGFYGRTAIYELLLINEDIRRAILEHKNAEDIKRIAVRSGMRTLRQDAWKKVLEGMTTPEEVLNVTAQDELSGDAGLRPAEAKEPGPAAEDPLAGEPVAVETRTIDLRIAQQKNQYDSRIYARVNCKANVRYSILHQDRNNPGQFTTDRVVHSSVTKDISAGGLRFISGYALPVGTILELTLELEKGLPGIHCLAKVCRVEDDTFSAMFHLVVYFLDISSADRAVIEDHVAQLRRENS